MVTLTELGDLQSFLQTNLVIHPDGTHRPCVLFENESPTDDSSGSATCGIIRIKSRTFDTNPHTPDWELYRSVIDCEYSNYIVNATTSYANFVNVIEDIKQQINEYNAANTIDIYEFVITYESANKLKPRTDFQIIRQRDWQDSTT